MGNININSTTVQCTENTNNSFFDKPVIPITIALFFDGTGNNRANVDYGGNKPLSYFKSYRKLSQMYDLIVGGSSYDNAYSNIVKLEQSAKSYTHKLYIEGIGTSDGEPDSLRGGALGKGLWTGTKAKSKKGIKQIVDMIFHKYGTILGRVKFDIKIDVFGFSRGAASARYFIYLAMESNSNLEYKLKSRAVSITNVQINFTGLFDTVASYGSDHKNDTKSLHLDAITNAKTVVHLCAAEEHRKNFPLTNIKSAKRSKQVKAIELFLPGVHSDIGGGYTETSNEKNLEILDYDGLYKNIKTRFDHEVDWLKESGWYEEEDIKDVDWLNQLIVNRKGIKNSYSLIPLNIMKYYATKYSVGTFSDLPDIGSLSSYEDKKFLKKINTIIGVGIKNGKCSNHYYWWNKNDEGFKKLRYNFFHFSAFFGEISKANRPRLITYDLNFNEKEGALVLGSKRVRKIEYG